MKVFTIKSEEHLEGALRRLSQWCFIAAISISGISLVGWYSGLLIVARLNPDYIPIAPSSAACISILSASLLTNVLHAKNSTRRLASAVGTSIVLLISVTLIIVLFLGTSFELEHMGIQSPASFGNVPTGHMSPITAATLLSAAVGNMFLVFSYGNRKYYKNITAYIAMVVVSIGFIVILGYLYGTPLLYGGNMIPVAFPTAIAFELIGLGLITASGPHVLPVRVLVGSTVRNQLMRAFLPIIIAFVVIEGWLYNTAFPGASNPALLSSLIAILSAIVIGIIVSKIARSIGGEIDRAHIERDMAEEMLKLDEDRLETLLKLALMEVKVEKELTDFALEEGVRLTKSKGGYLHLFNEDQQTIQLYSWSKGVLKTCTAAQDHHYPLDAAGVWADSIRLKKPVIHNDYQKLPDKKGYPEGHFHLVRHLGIPIFDGDRIVGVTGVGNKEEPYDDSDVRQINLFMHKLWGILKRRRLEEERERLILELNGALDKVKMLSGMLPICSSCKKIRDDSGYWQHVESYIHEHSEAEFSHGICPECIRKIYPDYADKLLDKSGD